MVQHTLLLQMRTVCLYLNFEILEQAVELFLREAGSVKRYIRPKNSNKPIMNDSQKRGYNDAAPIAKKYAKAMRVLGR